jgi:hypothetical protein
MTQYLISFGAHAMDHIPGDDAPAVAGAAHAVVQVAVNAGMHVSAGGLETSRRASWPPTGRSSTARTWRHRRFTLIAVPSREEALQWAAKIAVVCRCAQEVRKIGLTPNSPRCFARLRQPTVTSRLRLTAPSTAGLRTGLSRGRRGAPPGPDVKPDPRS